MQVREKFRVQGLDRVGVRMCVVDEKPRKQEQNNVDSGETSRALHIHELWI